MISFLRSSRKRYVISSPFSRVLIVLVRLLSRAYFGIFTRWRYERNTALFIPVVAMASDYPEDSFGIDLVPAEGERGFHTKINPQQPFQRSTIHEDRRALAIKCSLVDVIHGRWCADGDDNDYYATLLVLDFLFDVGNKLGRRIKSAKITVTFYGESDDDDHPGVVNISLNGSYSLLPTTQSETITNGLTASASANVLSAGQLSLGKKLQQNNQ